MGMYTELKLECMIKKDAPEKIIKVLDFLFNPGKYSDEHKEKGTLEKIKDENDHPFFKCDRWLFCGTMGSAYFPTEPKSSFIDFKLETIFNLKNYDDEIKKFLSFIHPYIDEEEGKFLGYWQYEEDERETPIVFIKKT